MGDVSSPVAAAAVNDGGWSWDSSGAVSPGPPGGGTREEALCSAAVWGLTSAHALQAAALASLAADRALLALGSRPRRFRAAQARYHVCVLAVVSALVGAAGVFARGGGPPPPTASDDPCLFLPHQLDSRFALFWICLHGGLLLSGAALVAMVSARLCCCMPKRRLRGAGASTSPEDDSGCCDDEEEEAVLPVPSPCDTSTAASTASTTASGRCGSTAALYAAASAAPNNKCACAGTDVSMAFRWTEPPAPRGGQDLRAELRWSTVVSLMALYYILNHIPVLAVTVIGSFAPWLLPRGWPLGTLVLWAGLAQDALLPLVLTLADARFAGWARRLYSGSSSSSSSPNADELRRQHLQHQHQLRQQQLEARRREQQKHLLHQQLQQQLQERRRRLEMTLDSPLPIVRAERREEAPYAVAPITSSTEKIPIDGKESSGRPFHLAPPWKQKNSISVESLFTSKSDLSQQMSPPYAHQTLTTSSVPSSVPGSNSNTGTVGSAGGGHMKFPLTNGSLFTVGADGRYPVVRNYRRGSNGALQTGRMGSQMVTNPRCDASVLPLMRGGGLTNLEGDITMTSNCDSQGNLCGNNGNGTALGNSNNNSGSNNGFGGFTGHSGPRGRPVPMVAPSEAVISRLEGSDSEVEEEEPIYATLSSLEEDCEEEPEGDDEEDEDDEDDEEDDDDEDGRPASPMSSCSVTTAANDDFEYRDAKGGGGAILVSAVDASNCRRQDDANEASNGDDTDIEEVIFRLPERSVPSALGLYRLRLDELAESCKEEGASGAHAADVTTPQGVVIRSPHNFHRRRYRRVPPHQHQHHQHHGRRLGVPGVVLSVDSLQTALARPDAVAYLDNGERMSGSVPDFKKVFVSEFI
ncbi:uncharacterized protein LOC124157038 [Ischnura elegans]|uniref:uncharacterized protein LOC124157038 n=1 Tax=Ischnura elegans TaxID=197161 RepID=UPI001ED88507|nr:uncharacterized protein LOC124157038 [Ischnura elegans]